MRFGSHGRHSRRSCGRLRYSPLFSRINPVGKCIIQPGSASFQLGGLATADVLFVVDDSGSMQPEQARLAANFKAFIDSLAATQADRQNSGEEPFDFHIAITTSSIFESWKAIPAVTCGGTPALCDVKASHYSSQENQVACTEAEKGLACDDLLESYYFQTTNQNNINTYCATPGLALPGTSFPAGNFVAAQGNPLVLHFTKDLKWSTWGSATPDPALQTLVTQFQQNINVGSCGSGMEQHIEAGRLAVERALQMNGLKQPASVLPADWPHTGSKLVLVFVGDEDDCSNPNDPTQALAFDPANPSSSTPGADVCVAEQTSKSVASQKLFNLDDYVSFFTSLSRPLGAAFVYSAETGTGSCAALPDGSGNVVCKPGTCTCQCPSTCTSCSPTAAQPECQIPATCGGKIPFLTGVDGPIGSRFSQLSQKLRAKGASTFEASVCDADWSSTLAGIAELVKPPPGLTLPTQPAESQVTVLRIQSADGKTARYCTGPGGSADWQFIDCKSGAPSPSDGTTTTLCISINHAKGTCEANPGETYIAQYLGRVPAAGCTAASDCAANLGGKATDWQCYGQSSSSPGTCLCNASP